MYTYREDFKNIVLKKKLKQTFKGKNPTFSIYILFNKSFARATRGNSAVINYRNILYRSLEEKFTVTYTLIRLFGLGREGFFPTENLIQLINKKPPNSVLDFWIVCMQKCWNTSIGSHLVNKTDKCYLLCKIHFLGEKYRRNMVFRGYIRQIN